MAKYAELGAMAAMALLAVCGNAAGAAPPPTGGSISIEPVTGGAGSGSMSPAFFDAASDALAARGFTILEDPGHAAYIAELSLCRTEVGTGSAKVPAGRGEIAPGASGGVGAGVAIPLTAGKSVLVPLERIQLELLIRKRGEDVAVWRGTAVTVRASGTKNGADKVVAADLTGAMLNGYPAEPQGVVGVP